MKHATILNQGDAVFTKSERWAMVRRLALAFLVLAIASFLFGQSRGHTQGLEQASMSNTAKVASLNKQLEACDEIKKAALALEQTPSGNRTVAGQLLAKGD